MAPAFQDSVIIDDENYDEIQMTPNGKDHNSITPAPYKREMVWQNVIILIALHLAALYGLFLVVTFQIMFATFVWTILLHLAAGFSITCGAHRLFAHRSYKATFPYRLMMVTFNCIALQNDIIEWCRDHRVHHKFSETDADPHNANRGIFFSHVGWLMVRKHPEVKRQGKKVDMSDLERDPMLQLQRKYYVPLVAFFCIIMPTVVPLLWGESIVKAYFVPMMLRYMATLNAAWSVNSIAHTFGYRPYDQFIQPAENRISNIASLGEGWHNYHHAFPHDYRTSEFGWQQGLNISQMFIDFFAWIGWVYDRKVIANHLITNKKARTGDPNGKFEYRAGTWTNSSNRSNQ